MDSSRRTSVTGLCCNPSPAIRRSSSSSFAIPLPRPPIVKEGRTTTGYFKTVAASRASERLWQIIDRADSPPTRSTIPRNSSRFSPRRIASTSAPINLTPYFKRIPSSCNFMAALSAVCPPRVARIADGLSAAITFSRNSVVIGSIYVASANCGSVIIVAGFELTRITRTPSSFKTRQA